MQQSTTQRRRRWATRLATIVAAGSVLGAVPWTAARAATPEAFDFAVNTRVDRPVALNLNWYAYDSDGDPLTFVVDTGPTHGSLDDCTAGLCTYTPDSGYVGPDSLTFRAEANGESSAVASVTIDVTPNQPPEAFDAGTSVRAGMLLTIPLHFYAWDPDNDPLTFTITTPPSHGMISCSGSMCDYLPAPGFVGTDSVSFVADDGLAQSNIATLTIDVVPNTAPTASSSSAHVFTDTPTTLDLDAVDADFDVITYIVQSGPGHGTLSDCSSGSCVYTPTTGYTGTDSFTFIASDGELSSAPASVTITVGDPLGRVLILTSTVIGAGSSPEAMRANSLGYLADFADETQWTTLTTGDFDDYAALIVGDTGGNSSTAYDALDASKAAWTPAVTGNVILVGTDPTDHAYAGGQGVIDNGIAFAVDEPGKTGLYLTFSDTFSGAANGQPITFLSEIGGFTFGDVGGCLDAAHKVADHPALAGMTDATLSNWGCSVHNTFGTWPTGPNGYLVLAIATDGAGYQANDGTTGSPYILARGESLQVISDISLAPATTTLSTGTSHTVTATVTDETGPVAGVTVSFEIVSGPHAGATGTATSSTAGQASWSYTGTTAGQDTIVARFVDSGGLTQTSNTVTAIWQVVDPPDNDPPVPSAGDDVSGIEGSPIGLTGSASDPDGDTLTVAWSYTAGPGTDPGATCTFSAPGSSTTTITCTDDGTYTATLAASDGVNAPVVDNAIVTVGNAAPTVSIVSPIDGALVATGATVTVNAPLADAGANDTHTCTVDWGDSSASPGIVTGGVCTASHSYATLSVPTITVTVTDDDAATASATVMIVVSDNSAKVTGGGWWIGPDGSRVNTGLVAGRSGTAYAGQVQVRQTGGIRFHGTTVTTLSTSGSTATWTGQGRLNGVNGYTFTVTVTDTGNGRAKATTPDSIAITIRDASGVVVFSTSGTLSGGNLKVH